MMRWSIINKLIEKNNYKSYLEIGYYMGWSFDNVQCDLKVAVDPAPRKHQWMVDAPYGQLLTESETGPITEIYKKTSDEFFEYNEKWQKRNFDIIFIDGLHEANQVYKDIENSLEVLSPGGTIVLHDVNPPALQHTTEGVDGNWNGDVYKAVIDFQLQNNASFYTVDTDWGVGVLSSVMEFYGFNEFKTPELMLAMDRWRRDPSWETFNANRKELLNLISVEEFLHLLNETVPDNHSPAK